MKKIKRITKLSAYIMWNYLVRIPACLILAPVINLSEAAAWAAAQLMCFVVQFSFDKAVSQHFALAFITPKEFWHVMKMFITLKYKEEN